MKVESGGLLHGGELAGDDGIGGLKGVLSCLGGFGSGGRFWKVLMKFCNCLIALRTSSSLCCKAILSARCACRYQPYVT